MAFAKTLRSLLRNPNPKPRLSFSPTSLPHPPSFPAAPAAALTPLCSLLGPLFLSSTPWKLSQSATPLYLRGKERIFPMDLLPLRRLESGFGLRMAEAVGLEERRDAPSRGGEVGEARREDRVLNLPNLVSIGRMLSGPVIGWMIMNEWYLESFCALVISGMTDWLDGYLARKMNIDSVFGSYLDPLADKVLIGCVAVAMVEKGLLHHTFL